MQELDSTVYADSLPLSYIVLIAREEGGLAGLNYVNPCYVDSAAWKLKIAREEVGKQELSHLHSPA